MLNQKYGIVEGIKLIQEQDKVLEHIRNSHKSFEPDSLFFWRQHCKEGNTLLDIGAYTGLYTMLALSQGTVCFGYEPNPKVYSRALQNCKFNNLPIDKIFNFAIGEKDTVLPFSIPSGIELSSASGFDVNNKDRQYKKINVNVLSLDSVYKNVKINCIKIDVEGSELAVLRGSKKILTSSRPALIIEALTKEQRADITRFLKNYGYRNISFVDDRNLLFRY